MSTAVAAVPKDNSFFWRRLHSLSGLFPVGAFLLEHLFSNAYALRGADAYNTQVKFLTSLPFVLAFETAFIFVPILYHAGYGVYIWWRGESNVTQYPWTGNWLYTLQRYTGLVTFAYIIFHTWTQRFTGVHLMTEPDQAFAKVHNELASTPILAFYVIGITAACFHFAYGLWLFGCKWGLTPGVRAQRVSGILCAAFGAALAALGLLTLRAFV